MKMIIKKLLVVSILLAAANGLSGNISLFVNLNLLKTGAGDPVPTGSLFLLIADMNGDGFFGAEGASLGTGLGTISNQGLTFDGLGGDDLILGRANGEGPLNTPGVFSGTFNLPSPAAFDSNATADTWSALDPLAFVWIPTYDQNSSTLLGSTSYGIFEGSGVGVPVSGGAPWVTPTDGANFYELNAFTTDFATVPSGITSGDLNPDLLLADQSVIPEPSTYALILGTVGLALVYLKRRKAANEL